MPFLSLHLSLKILNVSILLVLIASSGNLCISRAVSLYWSYKIFKFLYYNVLLVLKDSAYINLYGAGLLTLFLTHGF